MSTVSDGSEQVSAPRIKVLKGNPTDDEVAALVAVLAGAVEAGGGGQGDAEFSRWGLPVDRLRYALHSWQRMSLQQRTHLRGR